MRLGQFLFTILLALIFLAIIGFVDWGTVGGWGLFMLILALIGPLIIIVSYWVIKLKDKKSNKGQQENKPKKDGVKWLLTIGGLIIFIGVISIREKSSDLTVSTNQEESFKGEESEKKDEEYKIEEESISSFTPTLINETVVNTSRVNLYPEIDSRSTHFLKKESRVEVIDETREYLKIVTSSGEMFWAQKDYFEIFSDEKNEDLDFVLEFGQVDIDSIAVRSEPRLFADQIFTLEKGGSVYVINKVPETIYLRIRIDDDYYYVMENAISW